MADVRSMHLRELLQPPNGRQPLQSWQAKPAIRYAAYVVLNYNDGSMIEIEKLEHVIFEVLEFAEGGTCTPPGLGWWLHPEIKVVFEDKVLILDVTVSASLALEAQVFWPK